MYPARSVIFLAALLLWAPLTLRSQLKVAGVFSDHMVLQRDQPIVIWGMDTPGQEVRVSMDGGEATATADPVGTWSVALPPRPAGGPYALTVAGSERRVFEEVLMGDVWVCGGQSNMEFTFNRLQAYHEALDTLASDRIRLMTVDRAYSFHPQRDLRMLGGWKAATTENVAEFSAVAYFFGQAIARSQEVPIGLISSNWGGTRAEPWISNRRIDELAAIRASVPYADLLAESRALIGDRVISRDSFERTLYAGLLAIDGSEPNRAAWRLGQIDTAEWHFMDLAGRWEATLPEPHDGIAWLTKQFYVPAAHAGDDLMLNLGQIDDYDSTWVNGVAVGGMLDRNAFRIYRVPAAVVQPGWNSLTLRVFDIGGAGGFLADGPDLFFCPPSFSPKMSLSTGWWVKPTVATEELNDRLGHHRPAGQAGSLFNAMIAPLTRMPVKGIIWYQGESNRGQPEHYRALITTLIADWRQWWSAPELPFLMVQLAAFGQPVDVPGASGWAGIQEAQLQAGLSIPHAGTAVAVDVGDADDIHPKDKRTVGERLARLARRQIYGEDIPAYGPTLSSWEARGAKAYLRFDHLGGGLVARGASDGSLQEFAVAGPDRVFHRATARIEGDQVVVSSPAVPEPVAIRYAWADNPERVNLYNRAGLPASPFRTDDW